jgi:hypothetical protein
VGFVVGEWFWWGYGDGRVGEEGVGSFIVCRSFLHKIPLLKHFTIHLSLRKRESLKIVNLQFTSLSIKHWARYGGPIQWSNTMA